MAIELPAIKNLIMTYKKYFYIAPIILFYLLILLLSRNIPISDDYSMLTLIIDIINSSGPYEILSYIFQQHNEHRIATTKIIFYFYYLIFGDINFKWLIFLGNLFQLLTFYLLLSFFKITNYKNLILLALSLIFFSFGSAESSLMAMAAISNYLVITLMVLAIYFVNKDRKYSLMFAIIFSIAAVYTQGNGLIAPFIISGYFFAKKLYIKGVISSFVALIFTYLYMHGYTSTSGHGDPLELIKKPFEILLFTVSFIGSAFGFGGSNYPILTKISLVFTLLLGTSIIFLTGRFCIVGKSPLNNPFLWLNIFVLLTALITALSRLNFGISQSMVSRYHMYSILAIVATIGIVWNDEKLKIIVNQSISKFKYIFYTVIPLYYLASFAFLIYFYAFFYSPVINGGYVYPGRDHLQAIEILKISKSYGIYN
jgi:hypothetical protein